MIKINPLLNIDGYKSSHKKMYPENTTLVYSNYTCRSTKRMPQQAQKVVVFGIQYMIKYINELWNENFFNQPKAVVIGEAKEYLEAYLGSNYDVSHFEELHDLGYLPIEIKALEEGSLVDAGIPLFTIKNTHPRFFWLTNFLETSLSTLIWKPVHSASLAYGYKQILKKYALETDENNVGFVNFQGHDFSFRGMQSIESAISSGMGFLTSFCGTDTIPAIQGIRHYYGDKGAGFSVPASEHSVMCAHGKEGEIDTLRYLMKQYPSGILSVVSDTWDLWKLVDVYLRELKSEIMSRNGKLVIRPDSGNPVDIICGLNIESFENLDDAISYFEDKLSDNQIHGEPDFECETEEFVKVNNNYYLLKADSIEWNRYDKQYYFIENYNIQSEAISSDPKLEGLIEILWNIFGGTINEQGYKVLDSHIGAIYGDSITLERAEEICKRLQAKGFASTNVVLGIGSYSMGYATRDNQGGAVKSTYCEVKEYDTTFNHGKGNGAYKIVGREIFKDPVTDDGTKKSAQGLLVVVKKSGTEDFICFDRSSWEQENKGFLTTVYLNGEITRETSLQEIRSKLDG